MFAKPVSPMVKKHGIAMRDFSALSFGIGVLFWVVAKWEDSAIMDPEMYGEVATGIPAEWWAGAIMGFAALTIAGIMINGHWRWSPILRFVGMFFGFVTYSTFAWSAWGAMDAFTLICAPAAVSFGRYAWLCGIDMAGMSRRLR
jgi:hypothetical protein